MTKSLSEPQNLKWGLKQLLTESKKNKEQTLGQWNSGLWSDAKCNFFVLSPQKGPKMFFVHTMTHVDKHSFRRQILTSILTTILYSDIASCWFEHSRTIRQNIRPGPINSVWPTSRGRKCSDAELNPTDVSVTRQKGANTCPVNAMLWLLLLLLLFLIN